MVESIAPSLDRERLYRCLALVYRVDLSEAKEKSFESLHACFTRELKPGLRPVDSLEDVMTSPCDCIIGSCGEIRDC